MKSILAAIFLFVTTSVIANTITVASITELQSAIKTAKPGDVILLKDGVYKTDSVITIANSGSKGNPIIISAEHCGKTEISGAGGFILAGSYIIVRDFKFTHASSRARSLGTATFCRWTNNIFETSGAGEDLTIAGSDNEIDHNTFQNKNAMGRPLAIRGTGSQIAERLWVHHNYFKNQKDQGGKNGAETFQFGLSGFSLSTSNSIVEFNLFEDCAGENELISVKASGVILRYNTIRNCPAQFTLRHGNKCQVYGNYFFNTPGLRFFGDDHIIYSNYFQNCNPAINIGNGDGEVADGAQLTAHDRPDRVMVVFNTLVNCKSNITQSGRKDGLGATFITIENNIIYGGGASATISGPLTNASWQKNIVFKTSGNGDMPATGFKLSNPRLKQDGSGLFRLQKASAVTKVSKKEFPYVITDMDGQKRNVVTDAGADEFSKKAVIVKPLTAEEVGCKPGG
jgi:poly(beta-D-mannuronate) lyase